METVTVYQYHHVEVAKAELAAQGATVVSVSAGGPWVIGYEPSDGPKKPRAKKAADKA